MDGYKSKRQRNKKMADDYKRSHPCAICGESRLACLDFHHSGDAKKDGISELVNDHVSLARLNAEMDKCIVVCSNCHRIIHFSGE